ncbi:S8 family serine peptidase [Haloarcula salinisoli]|uniref:S8 family serine peptidase n=1 Tax=Haloarcula salinisoli TaxID=2487746 RepID=A0A8J7YG11_9EURY|nr:S8 family serine peptidase [Halomicroarcula salinisoli]MBX0305255.1 S8 family serine peptidase [Halomicroarcula salinisoli]
MTDSNLTVGRRRFIQTTGLLAALGGFTTTGSASDGGHDYTISFGPDTERGKATEVLDEQLGADSYEITDHIERLSITEATVDDVEDPIDSIESHDRVDYAEEAMEPEIPDEPPAVEVAMTDAETADYEGDPKISYGLEKINGPTAWETTEGSTDVTLAVIDSAVDTDHVDLADRFTGDNGGYDSSDGDFHGTHVAGCAAATTGNGVGVAGASDSRLLAYQLNDGNSIIRDVADAVEAGADVINCSFRSPGFTEDGSEWVEPQGWREAFDDARASGVTVVSSASNSRDKPDKPDAVGYPAKFDSVIAVGATDRNDNVTEFSSEGAVDIAAPGNRILSTLPNDVYGEISGTSMASPIAAGVVGLLLDADPELSPSEVEEILTETAVDIGEPDRLAGAGRIDAAAAVEQVAGDSGSEESTLAISDPDGEVDGFERDYELGVTGSLEPTDINDHDSVDESTAKGRVDGGTDEYTFTGDLQYFGSKGAELAIDGESVDPSEVAQKRTIIVDETADATVSYEFEVGGDAEKGAYAGGGPDSIDGTTISGEVNGHQDSYRYTGEVSDWSAKGDGELTVYIDSEEASFGVTDGDATFGQNVYTGNVNETVEFTVELTNTDTATVQVGGADDVGYYVAGEVSDTDGDGSVTVVFDSAAAGTDQTVLSAPESGGEVSKVTQGGEFDGSDSLDAVEYPLRVRAGEKTGDSLAESDADGMGTLSLKEPEQSPYNGPHELPGRVQGEDFDTGGQGVAYNDTGEGNRGGEYRDTDVDIGDATEGGYFVGWIEAGEWWEYTVEVTEAGTYPVEALVASDDGGGSFTVEVDGESVSTSFDDTGGWQSWTTVSVGELELEQGETVVRITSDERLWNLNWFEFVGGESADIESGVYELHNVETDLLADVEGESEADGTDLIQWPSNGQQNQRFQVSADGDAYTLTAQHSGKYLTASDGNVVQKGSGDPSDSQRWTFVSADTGYVLENVATGDVMTAENPNEPKDATIDTAADEASETQQWELVEATDDNESADVKSGVYEFHNVETGRVADVAYNSQDDGANVIQYADWDDENQRFQVRPDGDAYTITAQHSNRYLAASDGNVVQDGGEDPSDSQRWTFESADTGYVVKNVASGEVMTVEDPGDRWGGNIGTAADEGDETQQWELDEV